MGSAQSSHAKTSSINNSGKKLSPTTSLTACEDGKYTITTTSTTTKKATDRQSIVDVLTDALKSADDASVSETMNTSVDEDDDVWEEEDTDEEWEERLQILADARSLKQVAGFFLHPERPVESSPTACAHCYFDHPIAPELAAEQDAIFQDLVALKKLSKDYLHPEAPVVMDPAAMGRNYFERPSAVPIMDQDEAEERARILQDAKALKKLAIDYLHPELPVQTTDPTACSRNYFTRPSAPEQDVDEEERTRAMDDVKALKQLAKEFLHPELPVTTLDPTACGRNYFTRASAPEQDAPEDEDERARILEDTKMLKKLAMDYLHPELSIVTSDATATGRNFFTRPSAPEYDGENEDERAQVLKEAKALKQLAVEFMHPELPVTTTDPTAFGRNYFSRASALEQDDAELEEERVRILDEAKVLKQLAIDFMHPELSVVTCNDKACGRDFFSRPSAPEYDAENEGERMQILKEANALKQLAVEYMHPELPVGSSDPTAFGRNYFSRAFAPDQDNADLEDERVRIFEELKVLKRHAIDYMHPERPVVTSDAFACGRNYFSRASGPDYDAENEEERMYVLKEAKALKQLAVEYMHPELPVVASDPNARGRNYFGRASAPVQEDSEDEAERLRIMEDMQALKWLASDYLHPERAFVTSDPFACGRNYFSRASAPEYDAENEEERMHILEDLKALKQVAVDYMHPELPVATLDPMARARNFFSRACASEQEDPSLEEERLLIMEDLKALKQKAVDFMHPEIPTKTTDAMAVGRNFFARADAPGHYEMIHTFAPHKDDYDHTETLDHTDYHHEHLDHFGMDEDMDFTSMLGELTVPLSVVQQQAKFVMSDQEAANLSRSPSSVMLFTDEPMYD